MYKNFLLLLLLFNFFACKTDQQTGDKRISEPEDVDVFADTQWTEENLRNIAGWDVTFQRPNAVQVEKYEDTFTLKYIGPDAEPNTEITDGFFSSVQVIESSVEEYLENQTILNGISDVRLSNKEAKHFQSDSEMGDESTNHYVYQLSDDGDFVADIIYSVYGDVDNQYQNELMKIFESMNWEK